VNTILDQLVISYLIIIHVHWLNYIVRSINLYYQILKNWSSLIFYLFLRVIPIPPLIPNRLRFHVQILLLLLLFHILNVILPRFFLIICDLHLYHILFPLHILTNFNIILILFIYPRIQFLTFQIFLIHFFILIHILLYHFLF